MELNPIVIDVTDTTAETIFWPPGMPYNKRITRFYEIELITGGAGRMTTDGKTFRTVQGDIYFRKPGITTQGIAGYYAHGIAFDPFEQPERKELYYTTIPYWITDNNTQLEDFGFYDSYPDCYNTRQYTKLRPLFAEISSFFQVNRMQNEIAIKELLKQIFSMIDEELRDGKVLTNSGGVLKHYDKIAASKAYIDNNLEKKFTLEELAEFSGFSKNFYSKQFKKITGSTPFEYINESRMLLARKLILTTNIGIDQIIHLCGYDDRTYFYRIFKKRFQTTPALYRKAYMEEIEQT